MSQRASGGSAPQPSPSSWLSTLGIERVARPAAVVGLLMLAVTARAEGNPYSIGAGVSYNSDDNLFRAPPGQEVDDRFTTLSVFGGVDQTIGRQRLQANATLRRSHFEQRSDLDNTGYNFKLGWTGATVEEISWDLSYEAKRRLASYGTVVLPQFRVANIETNNAFIAGVKLGMAAQWVAGLTASHRDIDYSAAVFAGDRVRMDAIGIGVQWNPLGPLSATIGPRYTRGRYPQSLNDAGVEGDDFKREDLDFGLRWVASGASTVTARFSLTRQRDDQVSARNFDGTTGQLGWQWVVTGKTKLNASLSRDTGSESSFFTETVLGESLRGTGDNSQITNSFAARLDYELTGKISLSLGGQYALRRLATSTTLANGSTSNESGDDRYASATLGLRYLPTRNSVLGCEVGYQRRGTRTTLSSPYRANTAYCSAQLTLN